MMSQKTKTIILVIGILIACLLLLQGLGFGFVETGSQMKPIKIEMSSMAIKDFLQFDKVTINLFEK